MPVTIRIKDLPESDSFGDESYIPIDDSNGTKKIKRSNLLNSFSAASESQKGLMSADDKKKLNSLSTEAPGLDLSIFIIGERLNGLQDGINREFYINTKIFQNSEKIYLGPAYLIRGLGYTVEYLSASTKIIFATAPGETDTLTYDAIKG